MLDDYDVTGHLPDGTEVPVEITVISEGRFYLDWDGGWHEETWERMPDGSEKLVVDGVEVRFDA